MTPHPGSIAHAVKEWQFIVWSANGNEGYLICLHRGSPDSSEHECVGHVIEDVHANYRVQRLNRWLQHRRKEDFYYGMAAGGTIAGLLTVLVAMGVTYYLK